MTNALFKAPPLTLVPSHGEPFLDVDMKKSCLSITLETLKRAVRFLIKCPVLSNIVEEEGWDRQRQSRIEEVIQVVTSNWLLTITIPGHHPSRPWTEEEEEEVVGTPDWRVIITTRQTSLGHPHSLCPLTHQTPMQVWPLTRIRSFYLFFTTRFLFSDNYSFFLNTWNFNLSNEGKKSTDNFDNSGHIFSDFSNFSK